MTTPGGLIRKMVYLPIAEVEKLQREVARLRSEGEEATESRVLRDLLMHARFDTARRSSLS